MNARRGSPIVALAILFACHSATKSETTSPAPSVVTGPDVLVRVGSVASPASSSEAAQKSFVPDAPWVDSLGECSLSRTLGSGATVVTAHFPSRESPRTQVTLSFDSAGHLVRYSERRGAALRIMMQGARTAAQRDSVLQATLAANRSTTVTLDYAVDQATVVNMGGGKPTQMVVGTVRAIEGLEQLGPPTSHLQRVRRLCSV